ncbi:hypothetical protein DFH09DRAFT_397202 [Mycena vulgaris]|nr:hypothetical protein DFH09DRAFT_397202 [Mycena vulgaris]
MCWPSLDVVATFHPHAPFHEAAQGRRLVHEAVVVARNCGRNDTKQKRSSTHSKQVPEGGAGRTSLFTDHEMATDTDIDEFINFALADTLFIFTISDLVDKHRMFLIQPREVFDADGRPSLERRNCSFDFLSNHIANRIAELAEAHVDKVQQQLVRAFNAPATRSAAGKLVECMLHRALIHKRMHVPTDLGGGQVAGVLELIGNAEGFVLEPTRQPSTNAVRCTSGRNPPTLLASDAILVTKTTLGLIQSSLRRMTFGGRRNLAPDPRQTQYVQDRGGYAPAGILPCRHRRRSYQKPRARDEREAEDAAGALAKGASPTAGDAFPKSLIKAGRVTGGGLHV